MKLVKCSEAGCQERAVDAEGLRGYYPLEQLRWRHKGLEWLCPKHANPPEPAPQPKQEVLPL